MNEHKEKEDSVNIYIIDSCPFLTNYTDTDKHCCICFII